MIIPLQRQGSNLGCVNIKGDEEPASPDFPRIRRPGPGRVSLSVSCTQRRQNQVFESKNMKNCLNQVATAPFDAIFCQNPSHRVWEASGIPPAPQNPPKKSKIRVSGFRG